MNVWNVFSKLQLLKLSLQHAWFTQTLFRFQYPLLRSSFSPWSKAVQTKSEPLRPFQDAQNEYALAKEGTVLK